MTVADSSVTDDSDSKVDGNRFMANKLTSADKFCEELRNESEKLRGCTSGRLVAAGCSLSGEGTMVHSFVSYTRRSTTIIYIYNRWNYIEEKFTFAFTPGQEIDNPVESARLRLLVLRNNSNASSRSLQYDYDRVLCLILFCKSKKFRHRTYARRDGEAPGPMSTCMPPHLPCWFQSETTRSTKMENWQRQSQHFVLSRPRWGMRSGLSIWLYGGIH